MHELAVLNYLIINHMSGIFLIIILKSPFINIYFKKLKLKIFVNYVKLSEDIFQFPILCSTGERENWMVI